MWEFLSELNKKGVTIILTTHYLEEAEQLCRNVAIISQGSIVAQGAIKELLANMDEESIVLDMDKKVSNEGLAELSDFHPTPCADNALELVLTKERSIGDAILKLSTLGYGVRSLRNKANRLEQFFISQTQTK